MKEMIFVETTAQNQRKDLCRWAEIFFEQGKRVLILTDTTLAAQHLDQLLWTFSQASFIPHRIVSETSPDSGFPEPVLIAWDPTLRVSVHVVLCDVLHDLEVLEPFDVAVQFVPLDDERKRLECRSLWVEAKSRGITLKHVAASKF